MGLRHRRSRVQVGVGDLPVAASMMLARSSADPRTHLGRSGCPFGPLRRDRSRGGAAQPGSRSPPAHQWRRSMRKSIVQPWLCRPEARSRPSPAHGCPKMLAHAVERRRAPRETNLRSCGQRQLKGPRADVTDQTRRLKLLWRAGATTCERAKVSAQTLHARQDRTLAATAGGGMSLAAGLIGPRGHGGSGEPGACAVGPVDAHKVPVKSGERANAAYQTNGQPPGWPFPRLGHDCPSGPLLSWWR